MFVLSTKLGVFNLCAFNSKFFAARKSAKRISKSAFAIKEEQSNSTLLGSLPKNKNKQMKQMVEPEYNYILATSIA